METYLTLNSTREWELQQFVIIVKINPLINLFLLKFNNNEMLCMLLIYIEKK